jgi:hypothetical protein
VDSQEIARLVERINQNYKDTLQLYYDIICSEEGYIERGLGITYEVDFTLVKRYLECHVPAAVFRFDETDPSGFRYYHKPTDSVEFCDKKLHGLKWEEKTVRIDLAPIKPSSIRVLESEGVSGPNLGVVFDYDKVYVPKAEPDVITDDEESFGIKAEGREKDKENSEQLSTNPEELKVDVSAFGEFRQIRCKDRSACEQIAADLKRLVEISRKYTGGKNE